MKTKKFERVENYLNAMMERNNQSMDQLSQLTYKDLMAQADLGGIGERTIANTLNAFKQKHGIKNVKRTQTKRKRVEDYFEELIATGSISIEELMTKRYNDFQHIEPLKGIGKTTITCALSDFKKNRESNRFEQSVLSFLENEHEGEDTPQNESAVNRPDQPIAPLIENLDNAEVTVLKEMIEDYKQNNGKEKRALQELQSALRFVGIDSNTLMTQYWNSKRNGSIPDLAIKSQLSLGKKTLFYDAP